MVVVVDCDLLPGKDLSLGDQSDYHAIPERGHKVKYLNCHHLLRMVHAAPDRVWQKGMVGLVSQGAAVLVQSEQ